MSMDELSADRPTFVLLVEDEVVLRMDAAHFLEEEGFNVIESTNGEHASTVIQRHPNIHVLFTDVHLPGSLGGVELAHIARKRWPSIVVLIVSGKAKPREHEMPTGSRFLPKPYHPKVAVRHINELLGRNG
jgi:two-component system, response regulator PdtaR